MEKEQKPLVEAAFRTSFREVVSRSIAIFLAHRLESRLGNIKVEAPNYLKLTAEQVIQIKRQYIKELLKDERFKKEAQLDLDDLYRNKTDLLEEILRQYSLHKNIHESTSYHDILSRLFDECLWNTRLLVKKGQWKRLNLI